MSLLKHSKNPLRGGHPALGGDGPVHDAPAEAVVARKKRACHIAVRQRTAMRKQTLAPTKVDSTLPVVVFCHGGGWQRGDRASEWRGGPVVGRAMARRGYVTAVLSYRLAPPSWPAILLRTTIVARLNRHSQCSPRDPKAAPCHASQEATGQHLGVIGSTLVAH